MTKKTVIAQRDFTVKKTSILVGTEFEGKTARDKQAAEWDSLDSESDIRACYTVAEELAELNELRMLRAKESAKTSSPWTAIETTLELLLKNKKHLSRQAGLDKLKGADVIPTLEIVETPTESAETIPEPAETAKPADEAKPRLRKKAKG